MLKGMAASGAFGLFGCATAIERRRRRRLGAADLHRDRRARRRQASTSPPGYTAQVLLRQGDPIRPGAPEYSPATQTGADQEQQFGTDNDFISFMPLPLGSKQLDARPARREPREPPRGDLLSRATRSSSRASRCEVQMAAQGFSITEIAKEGNHWRVVKDSRYNRRISANAPMRISGPGGAGTRACSTSAIRPARARSARFNNCAGGTTPWGTMLTAEENIQNYFTGDAAQGAGGGRAQAPQHHRQGPLRRLGALLRPLQPRQGAERAEPLRLDRRDRSRTIRTTPR